MSKEVKRWVVRPSGLDGVMPVNEFYTGRDQQYVLASDYEALLADRGRLAAENERLGRDAKNDAIAYRAVIDRQEELRSELEALKKDAERYRWLRDIAGNRILNELARDCTMDGWDAKIDAALQGAQP